jgi:hypothetical protein
MGKNPRPYRKNAPEMADGPLSTTVAICFRLPIELRRQVDANLSAAGATLSEWYRALTIQALGGQLGFEDGYREGRNIALDLTRRLLIGQLNTVPASYEEAIVLIEAMDAHQHAQEI